MTYILAFVLIGVIADCEVFAGTLPFQCSKEQDAFYPHPVDCQAFYECVNGTAYLHNCSKGLRYNQDRQQCDLEARAGCGQSRVYSADHPLYQGVLVEEPPDFVKCSSANCLCMCPAGKCEEFYYICKGSQVYKVNCSATLKYNPSSLQCDLPENIKECIKECPKIKTPHPCNCIQRYSVEECDKVTEEVCPPGTAFNSATEECDSKTFKDSCDGPVAPTTCEGRNFGDSTNCRVYYTCTKGDLMTPKRCPSGTAFNKAKRICDRAAVHTECKGIGVCLEPFKKLLKSRKSMITRSSTPSTAPSTTTPSTAPSTTTPSTTPSTTTPSTTTSTTTPSTTPSTTGEVGGSSCPKFCVHDGHSPHPTHCRRFCHCSNGLNYEKKCPGATHWSQEKDRCESPGVANCKLLYLWEE